MKNVEEFLAYAIRLEQEAALRFDELADACLGYGNKEVADFFRELAGFSRKHLAQAKERGGFRDVPHIAPREFQWADGESPEAAEIWGADAYIDIHQALQLALNAEQRSADFYRDLSEKTDDPEIRILAEEFAAEEAEHVAAIRRWITAVAA